MSAPGTWCLGAGGGFSSSIVPSVLPLAPETDIRYCVTRAPEKQIALPFCEVSEWGCKKWWFVSALLAFGVGCVLWSPGSMPVLAFLLFLCYVPNWLWEDLLLTPKPWNRKWWLYLFGGYSTISTFFAPLSVGRFTVSGRDETWERCSTFFGAKKTTRDEKKRGQYYMRNPNFSSSMWN